MEKNDLAAEVLEIFCQKQKLGNTKPRPAYTLDYFDKREAARELKRRYSTIKTKGGKNAF